MRQFCLIKKDIYKNPQNAKKRFRVSKSGCLLTLFFPSSAYEEVISLFPKYMSAKSDSRIHLHDTKENEKKLRNYINKKNLEFHKTTLKMMEQKREKR